MNSRPIKIALLGGVMAAALAAAWTLKASARRSLITALEPTANPSSRAPSEELPLPPRVRVESEGQQSLPEPKAIAASDAAPGVDLSPRPPIIGDRRSWPGEYADKQLAVLVADEKRLRSEYQEEVKREFSKRFQEGRYMIYRASEYPPKEPLYGEVSTQADEHSVKVVWIDPRIEPEFFIKQTKANWLLEQIDARRH